LKEKKYDREAAAPPRDNGSRVRPEDVGLAPAKQADRIAAAYRLGLELG
jgi:hypothetical protein